MLRMLIRANAAALITFLPSTGSTFWSKCRCCAETSVVLVDHVIGGESLRWVCKLAKLCFHNVRNFRKALLTDSLSEIRFCQLVCLLSHLTALATHTRAHTLLHTTSTLCTVHPLYNFFFFKSNEWIKVLAYVIFSLKEI